MLCQFNHPYYPNRNKEIDLFVASIILIVTTPVDALPLDRVSPRLVEQTLTIESLKFLIFTKRNISERY